MTTESSVLVNLKGLFEMEAERREHEALKAAQERAQAEARRAAEEKARELAAIAAREAEQARLERVRVESDLETQARLSALRGELERVREQRAQLQAEMQVMAARSGEPTSSKRGWIAGSLAGMSLAAAAFATILAWPNARSVDELAQPTVAPVVEQAPVVAPPAVTETPSEPVAAIVPEQPVSPVVRPVHRPHVTTHVQDTHDMLSDLDREGDSVLSDEFLRNADDHHHVRCARGHRCR